VRATAVLLLVLAGSAGRSTAVQAKSTMTVFPKPNMELTQLLVVRDTAAAIMLDESDFPILWTEDGRRSAWIDG